MTEVHVAVPSLGRAGRVRVFGSFPTATLYVPQRQASDYRHTYPDRCVVAVPDEVEGNIARKRNWILDHAPSRWVLMLDDDLYGIGRWEGQETVAKRLEPSVIEVVMAQGFRMAEEAGVHLWGLNLLADRRSYSTFRPFNLLAPVLGPFAGHVLPTLRYDERFLTKEDYDFFLQHIERYRRVLRFNKYLQLKEDDVTGGLTGWRTLEREGAMADLIQAKWGPKLIRYGRGKSLLDGRVQIPIPGC